MDIAAWLESLGLGRYAPAFRDNDVDAEVLPRLTADDLTGLGVASVGHRRKLLDAIAALRAGDTAAPAAAAGLVRDASRRHAAHRRPRGRAAAAHGHVRRPGRLDRALGAARPRGDAAR